MEKENLNPESKKLLFKLTINIVALTGIFSTFLVFVYIVGNFQGFQDSTQMTILAALGLSSIFFGIISFFGLIESIIFFFLRDILKPIPNVIFLLSMIICVVLAVTFVVMSIFLSVLSGGI